MAYVKFNHHDDMVGKKVILTQEKTSCAGKFEIGSVVTITDVDYQRGFTFSDDEGNSVCEAGFTGFKEYVDYKGIKFFDA